ncbi:RNA polymerase sigma factor, partial [Bacteroidota bacterium]
AMTRNREDTLDLVQETILKAFESFENLKDPQAFKSYLFTIASRIFKRQVWRKRLFLHTSGNDEDAQEFEDLIEPGNNPEILHDIKALQEALLKIPDKQREAVTLYEIVGFSMPEISKIQGCSLAGVKSRVQRARKALEQLLGVHQSTRYSESQVKIDKNLIPQAFTNKAYQDENILYAEVHHEYR